MMITKVFSKAKLIRLRHSSIPIREVHFLSTFKCENERFDYGRRATNNVNLLHYSSTSQQLDIEEGGPRGNLFHSPIGDSLLNKTASIRRTFSPRSNAQAMLICGGPILAAHASFDPNFDRARSYIRNHAVGPAVLSPILISGLIGALIEASLPQSFLISSDMKQHLPLIVGVQVEATIKVISVIEGRKDESPDATDKSRGYELLLGTEVKTVSDGRLISEGSQKVWMPQ